LKRNSQQSASNANDRYSNKHLLATAGLTSGGVGLSFGVVGSRFTALGGVTALVVPGMPDDAPALVPGPGFM